MPDGGSAARRSIGRLAVATLLASLAGCGRGPAAPAAGGRPNVLLITVDTLRPDHLGCYGYARDTSPNIDAFAKDCVIFDNAQTAAPWTAPSLLSLMTSLYPSVHGVVRFNDPGQMNERVTTLAEVLKKHGYWNAAFTEGGYAKPQFGLKQGFDVFPLNEGDLPHNHWSNIEHTNRLPQNVERTLVWLKEAQGKPFFLFFHTYQVHAPYVPPETFVKPFRPGYDETAEHAKLAQVIQGWLDTHEIDADGVRLILAHNMHCGAGNGPEGAGLPRKAKEYGIDSLDAERMAFWRDLYDGEIAFTDSELKRLLDALEQPALRDNTVVVFVSDHGEAFGEHGTTQHGSVLFEEDLHVLFMLRAPGVAPSRVKDLVRSIDMMPTALELLGVAFDKTRLQGRSLAPLLRGETLAAEPTFSHAISRRGHEGHAFTIRDGKWRFVWDDDDKTGALYDLESDPGELHDVAAQNAKIAERLQGLLNAQRGVDAELTKRVSGPVGDYMLDADMRKQLRDLGYFGDDPPPPHDDQSK